MWNAAPIRYSASIRTIAAQALAMIGSLDPQEWGTAWMTRRRPLLRARTGRRARGDSKAAQQGFLAAWRLYTFGRWPVASSPNKLQCYESAKRAFAAYGQCVDPKIETIRIPFEGKEIVAFLQKPPGVARPPVVISIGGSDLWKDTVAIQSRAFLPWGIAVIAVDKPGTGDAPLPVLPGSERIYSALIDHVRTRADLDGERIIVRGQSWGSYWSARTGYAEAARLRGVVFQSGPVHHYFQRDWQQEAFKTREFLFDYVPSRLHMLGPANGGGRIRVHAVACRLLDAGLIHQPTPPMLLIAGAKDTQVPFSDFLLLLQQRQSQARLGQPGGRDHGPLAHCQR